MIKMPYLVDLNVLEKEKNESISHLLTQEVIVDVLKKFDLSKVDLEENWIEFLNYNKDHADCMGCRSIDECSKSSVGMIKNVKYDGGLNFYLTPCKYGQEFFNNQSVLQSIALRNVGDDLLLTKASDLTVVKQKESNANSIVSKMMDYLKNPSEKGFYLHGAPGTGKSTMMGWLIRALVLEGHQCGYIHFPTFLMDIKNSFGEEGSGHSIEKMKNIQYLVIDDIGGESVTQWSRDEILSGVLAYRSQNKKPTFFTSVYPYSELKKYYNLKSGDNIRVERLIDRMKAVSVELHLVGQDLR